jgi:hypothetical protein
MRRHLDQQQHVQRESHDAIRAELTAANEGMRAAQRDRLALQGQVGQFFFFFFLFFFFRIFVAFPPSILITK